ncbi:hypothetical protein F5Y11DRAFT_19201 [Daldinia sp. FL1419]|nr:hypothetical protein F5Y11DRAFT_19201 [Daldinia sp. FL1419]
MPIFFCLVLPQRIAYAVRQDSNHQNKRTRGFRRAKKRYLGTVVSFGQVSISARKFIGNFAASCKTPPQSHRELQSNSGILGARTTNYESQLSVVCPSAKGESEQKSLLLH